ncbi:MAG: mechanosensitive ion channel domain-containing protein [Thermoplasmatota archaeon]
MTGHGDGNATADNATATPPSGGSDGPLDSVLDTALSEASRIGGDLGAFLLVLAVAYLIGRGLRALYERARRSRPTSGQLFVGRALMLASLAVGLSVGLSAVYGVDPLGMVATLGIVSLALGFGLQNTVANIAAGIGLTMDKPFDVGDRIRVGQTWGDVESIGLRSTRITTTSGEYVVVPNAILDTQEVWNYTRHETGTLRLEVPFGISYESSVELAESVALAAARSHVGVLAFPEPVVRLRNLGQSSLDLELRCWLGRAQDKAAVQDALLRQMLRRFNEVGVAVPFPQRTITYHKDLPEPAPTPEFHKGDAARKPVVLVCTRGSRGAQAMADRVLEFVAGVGGRLMVLNVRPPQDELKVHDPQAAINLYMAKAQAKGVPAQGRLEVGDFAAAVNKVVAEVGARLVVLGESQRVRLGAWMRVEVQQSLHDCPVPVLFLDTDRVADEAFLQEWKERLAPKEQSGDPSGSLSVPSPPPAAARPETDEPGDEGLR